VPAGAGTCRFRSSPPPLLLPLPVSLLYSPPSLRRAVRCYLPVQIEPRRAAAVVAEENTLNGEKDETCPVSTGRRTRRVQLVQEGGGGGGLNTVGVQHRNDDERDSLRALGPGGGVSPAYCERRDAALCARRVARCSTAAPPPPSPSL